MIRMGKKVQKFNSSVAPSHILLPTVSKAVLKFLLNLTPTSPKIRSSTDTHHLEPNDKVKGEKVRRYEVYGLTRKLFESVCLNVHNLETFMSTEMVRALQAQC